MQPRIYTYKITFEEVPYYYYGSKKEKVFDEEYWGSPVTNKWCWELYTPKKQILEVFEYTNEGYIKAQEVESRLIKPVYNTDKWCLNANCGGKICLSAIHKNRELRIGIFGLSKEKRSETGKKSAQKAKENRTGIFALTREQIIENAKKGGIITSSKLNSQKWICLETGMISTIGPLTRYQRVRGIDTKKRIRLE